MRLSFFPRVAKFFDLFHKQNDLMLAAGAELDRLFHDPAGLEERCLCINNLEVQCASLSREIAAHLNASFITPLDREDIYAINFAHKEMVGLLRAISTRVALYHFSELRAASLGLVRGLKAMLDETGPMLRDLQAGKTVEAAAQKVRAAKYGADRLLLVALGEIYELPLTGNQVLLDMLKWSQLYDRIELALDQADALAAILEGVSVKK